MDTIRYQELLQRYIAHGDEKQLVIKKIVEKLVDWPVPSPILDVGCGTGFISNAVADLGYEVTAIDIKNSFVPSPYSKNPVAFIRTDVFAFNPKRKFDVIIAAYVFWEIPFEKWEELMNRFFVLLNTGGKLFVVDTVNNTPYDNTYVDFNIRPEKKNSDELKDYWYTYLNTKKYTYEKNLFETHITAKNPEEMYEVLEFFFEGKSRMFYENQKKRFLGSFAKNQTKDGVVLRLSHSLDVISKNR